MKRLLLISYYWPPAGGGGVMRWLKMSGYIQALDNWQVIVFHPKKAKYLVIDPSLKNTVHPEIKEITLPILEPNNILAKLGFKETLKNVAAGGVGANKKPSLMNRLMVYIRSNLFIPDARAWWIKPSSKFLLKNWDAINADIVVSTGPPHSMHLIALALKKRLNVKWVADYRDPWTFIDFAEDLNMSDAVINKHKKLEKEVFHHADKVVTVSQTWAKELERLYQKEVVLIHNGYDPADFQSLENKEKGEKLKLIHIGSINKDRNAPVFWNALRKAIDWGLKEGYEFQVDLIGNFSPELMSIIKEKDLDKYVYQLAHLPHNLVLEKLKEAHVSLLFINNTNNKGGIIPGKLYEYLAANNPIMAIGEPDGDAAKIIKDCEAGFVFDFEEEVEISKTLIDLAAKAKNNKLNDITNKNYLNYSRKELAIKYAKLLEDL